VRHGQSGLSVYAELRLEERVHRLGVSFLDGTLDYRIDRLGAAGVTDIARLVRLDIIDPGVHSLIEGGPSERRRFLDWGVFHVEQDYLREWRRYRRALGQRNAALKQGASGVALDSWNAGLIEAGERIGTARSTFVARLAPEAASVGVALLGRPIKVAYRRGWRAGLTFRQALEESIGRDAAMGYTQVGPHRSDLSIELGQWAIADEASRGQQKLAAAGLVIAQIRVTGDQRDTVLLVDDPAAELDGESVRKLLEALDTLECQLVFTGLGEANLGAASGAPVFHVEQGRLRAVR
jgi:DNA replication and repair protein RecF